MSKMIKCLVGTFLCMILLAGVAGAEKTDYKNENYNFKAIKTIAIYDVDFEHVKIDNDILKKNLQSVYEKKAKDTGLGVMTGEVVMRKMSLGLGQDLDTLAVKDPAAADKLYDEHLKDYVDAYVTAVMKTYEGESVHHPGYTTMEKRTKHVKITDNGKVRDIAFEYEEPVYHPDYYTYNFYTAVEFHVYDAKTNEEIFSRLDTRGRQDNQGKDMYERICGNFFGDLSGLIK